MNLRRAEPCGIFSVDLHWNGGSFDRKFIIPSGLIPNTPMFRFFSAAAERRGIKPDFRIKKETIALRRTIKHKLPDCIVAATAIVLNATLLTVDEKLLRLKWQNFNVRNIV
jgi:PIN domain nuclease of toxin-antitoxin system